FSSGETAFPLQVLGLEANRSERINLVASPQPRMAINHDMTVQPAFGAENDILSHNAVGPNMATIPNLRFRMDDGSRVDDGGGFWRGRSNLGTGRFHAVLPGARNSK